MQLTTDQIFAGRYRLLSKIGVGGFSEVWKVADEMAEDRVMVLKVYAPERGLDEFGIKQFRREYAITHGLNHRNLLKANHFDIAGGSPYLVMPFCEGGSLYGKLQENGTLTEKQVAEMLVQVADGLEYLHRKDIVHQDIKPDNILIDGDGNYLLTDFGISSKLRSTLQKSTTTAKSMTVAYAPPEKFNANSTIGAEGDIFSLGVLMFEALTDNLPWNGMGGAYVRPDSELPALPASFSPGLSQLIQRCVQFDASKRPAAQELKQLAREFLAKEEWDTPTPIKVENARKTISIVERPKQPEPKVLETFEQTKFKQEVDYTRGANTMAILGTHLYMVLAHLIGMLSFVFAGVMWCVIVYDKYEYNDNIGYSIATSAGFLKVMGPTDYLFFAVNIGAFSLWLLFWNKLMMKWLISANLRPKSAFNTTIVYCTLSVLIPAILLVALQNEKEIDPLTSVFWLQCIGSIIMTGILLRTKLYSYSTQTKAAIEAYTVWWKIILVVIGAVIIAVPLLVLRIS
jgi:hypothetical protein